MEAFASCLNEEGVVLACNEYSPECKEQKAVFSEGFRNLNYKNCDFAKDFCQSNSISSFPAWVFPTGKKIYKVMNATSFGKYTECKFNMTG